MSQENMQDFSAAVREVMKRSVVDPDFRQLAVKDSTAALAKINPSLSSTMKIKFVDNFGSDHKVIALPDPISSLDELTEEQLEQIAGGCTATSCAVSGARSE